MEDLEYLCDSPVAIFFYHGHAGTEIDEGQQSGSHGSLAEKRENRLSHEGQKQSDGGPAESLQEPPDASRDRGPTLSVDYMNEQESSWNGQDVEPVTA